MEEYTEEQVLKVQETINMLIHTADKTDELAEVFDEGSRDFKKFCENVANNIGFAICVLLPIATQNDKSWRPAPCEHANVQSIVDCTIQLCKTLNEIVDKEKDNE